MNKWICCQLGAREHYSIPRALNDSGLLAKLVTDAWVNPDMLISSLAGSRFQGRFHSELDDIPICSWNSRVLALEALIKLRGEGRWKSIVSRNEWFQQHVTKELCRLENIIEGKPIIFSYSYTAERPFRFAKRNGWATVLGQIDPGPDENIVAQEISKRRDYIEQWEPAPKIYWDGWRRECELSDVIIANSEWSKSSLITAGIAGERISVIPLAYQRDISTESFVRRYPRKFTARRPMKLLFLGQVNLRKGIAALLESMGQLSNMPVELNIVGPLQISVPPFYQEHPTIHWHGAVHRGAVEYHYKNSDVFILPTLSDGFALTQLEAQAWRLPVIASRFCGDVVEHGRNGLLLDDISIGAITQAIRQCIDSPELLVKLSRHSEVEKRFSLGALSENLHNLTERLAQ